MAESILLLALRRCRKLRHSSSLKLRTLPGSLGLCMKWHPSRSSCSAVAIDFHELVHYHSILQAQPLRRMSPGPQTQILIMSDLSAPHPLEDVEQLHTVQSPS